MDINHFKRSTALLCACATFDPSSASDTGENSKLDQGKTCQESQIQICNGFLKNSHLLGHLFKFPIRPLSEFRSRQSLIGPNRLTLSCDAKQSMQLAATSVYRNAFVCLQDTLSSQGLQAHEVRFVRGTSQEQQVPTSVN